MNDSPARTTPDSYELRWFTDDVVGPAFVIIISLSMVWVHRYNLPDELLYFGGTVLFFTLLSICLSLLTGRYLFSEDGVIYKNIFTTRQMHWSEIRRIEAGEHWERARESLLLVGKDRQFLLAPPRTWLGPNKAQILALMRRKFAERGWSVQETRRNGALAPDKRVRPPRW
jgi:hypothetical protein